MTKKARFIKNMTTLSDKEKAQVIAFFNKYPNYESHIDWNKKELRYSDFEKVFALAQASKTNKKQKAKENPRMLFEGYNCEILYQTDDFIVIVPLDHECAVFFNSFNCGGEGAKWCIGDSNNPSHWYNYVNKKTIFALVYFTKKQFFYGKKIIFEYRKNKTLSLWHQNNKLIAKQKLLILINILSIIWFVFIPWSLIFFNITRYYKITAKVFKVIQKNLPVARRKLLKKIITPKYVVKDSGLKYWVNKNNTEVNIPAGVTSIGGWVFADNYKLKKITIPDGVVTLGVGAFSSCSRLTAINIPNSVTSIGWLAFSWCLTLESINIPDGVSAIEYGTFSYCENLKSIILPDSIETIEGIAFEKCRNLKTINLPKSLTYIGEKAFEGCKSLASITIPGGVNYIGKKAFYNCENLECVNIHKITRVAKNAFKGCKKQLKINRYGVNLSV